MTDLILCLIGVKKMIKVAPRRGLASIGGMQYIDSHANDRFTIKPLCLPVKTGDIVKPSKINLDAYNWVNLFAVQDLPATAKFIGFYFASFMNPRQQTCFPSLARIVSETGLSKPTVIKYLKVLEESEWIAITRQSVSVQSKGGVQAVNHYDLNIPQKVVNQINHPDEGSKILNQRWLNSELKVVNHVNPNNNSNNNNNNKRGFSPPTLQMVEQYCRERRNTVDPETFISFYASKGWMVGKTKMKDWKAAVVTWEKRERTAEPETTIFHPSHKAWKGHD